MFLLASTIALALGVPPDAPARATVRIVNSVKVSRSEWDEASQSHKKEVLYKEKDGRTILVRMIEYE